MLSILALHWQHSDASKLIFTEVVTWVVEDSVVSSSSTLKIEQKRKEKEESGWLDWIESVVIHWMYLRWGSYDDILDGGRSLIGFLQMKLAVLRHHLLRHKFIQIHEYWWFDLGTKIAGYEIDVATRMNNSKDDEKISERRTDCNEFSLIRSVICMNGFVEILIAFRSDWIIYCEWREKGEVVNETVLYPYIYAYK